MPTYRFEEVPRQFTKSVPCTVCGRKVRRQRTFSQTINPFNKNAAGQVKTFGEIYTELAEKGEAWQAEPETHTKCEQAEAV